MQKTGWICRETLCINIKIPFVENPVENVPREAKSGIAGLIYKYMYVCLPGRGSRSLAANPEQVAYKMVGIETRGIYKCQSGQGSGMRMPKRVGYSREVLGGMTGALGEA